MSEAQQIRAQVYIPGKEANPGPQKMLTLEMMCEWIRLQGLDDYTTQGLIEIARKYPQQALPAFRKNFNLMIARVRHKRQKETQNAKESSIEEQTTPSENEQDS